MEPPAKRSRIGSSPFSRGRNDGDDDDGEDELFHEPEVINANRDPAVQLERSRAVAAYKLKSSWETIFEKYAKDFTGVGDEIDLKTGEVVVDNGHIRSLNDAADDRSEAGSVDEEQRILHGSGNSRPGPSAAGALIPRPSYNGRLSGVQSFLSGAPRLSSMMFPSTLQFSSPMMSFGGGYRQSQPVESAWAVPELPAQAFDARFQAISARPAARRVAVKSLPAPADDDDDGDEDDILLGSSVSRTASLRPAHKDTQTAKEPLPVVTAPGADVEPSSGTSAAEDVATGSSKPQKSPKWVAHKDVARRITSKARGTKKTQVVISQDRQRLPSPPESGTNDSEATRISGDGFSTQQGPRPAAGTSENVQLIVAIPQRRRRPSSHVLPESSEPSSQSRKERRNSNYPVSISYPSGSPTKVPHHEDLSRAVVVEKGTTVTKRRKRTDQETPRGTIDEAPPVSSPIEEVIQPEDVSSQEPGFRAQISTDGTEPAAEPNDTSRPPKTLKPQETFSRNVVDPSYEFSDDDDEPAALGGAQIKQTPAISNAQLPRTFSTHNPEESVTLPPEASDPQPLELPQTSSPARKRKRQSVDSGSLPTIRKTFSSLTKHLPSAKAAGDKIIKAGKRALKQTLPTNKGASGSQDSPKSDRPNPRKRKDPPSAPQGDAPPSPAKDPARTTEVVSSETPGGRATKRSLPVTPNQISHLQKSPDKKPPSSSKLSIMSLVSDGEEDELSFELTSPLSSRGQPTSVFNWSRPSPMTAMAMKRVTAMKRRQRLDSHAKSSPLLSKSRSYGQERRLASSPTVADPDLVRTPRGSLRRCGEGGFRCDRDFCFTCL